MAIFWVGCGWRGIELLEGGARDVEVNLLWDRIHFWDSLWPLVSSEVRGGSFQDILYDWNSAVHY